MKFKKQEEQEIVNMFLRACKIDNPSGNEEKIAHWVAQELESLDIEPIIDDAYNVFFSIPGKGEPIFLNAHLDSVQPCEDKVPHFDGKTFFSRGETILGADNLEGVTIILSAINYLKTHGIAHRPLDIILTTGEEVGGDGIKQFDFSQVCAKAGVVLDSASPVGSIVIKAPSKYNFQIIIEGVPGHGGHSKKAFSAIKVMADLVNGLPIGQVDDNTKLNIGRIEGGRAINTIPGLVKVDGAIHALGDGEIRGENKDCEKVVKIIEKEIARVEKKYSKSKVKFAFEIVRYGYEFSPADPFIGEISEAIKKAKITPKKVHSFGTSDANTFNCSGYKGLLLGTGAKNLHTTEESVDLEDMLKLLEITINLCKITK